MAQKDAILMAIQPKVSTIPNAAWFIQYASGYLQWAQNAQSTMMQQLGIKWQVIEMGADQYNRLLSMATAGWNPAFGAIPGANGSLSTQEAVQSDQHSPDAEA